MRIRLSVQEEEAPLDEEERYFHSIAESAQARIARPSRGEPIAQELPSGETSRNQNNPDRRRAATVSAFFSSQRNSSRSGVQPAKRPRLSRNSSVDSKPAARNMTGPNRQDSAFGREEVEDAGQDLSSGRSWEENKPAPLRNHNYFKNHPRNSPLSETIAKPRGKNVARLKNYDDPVEESIDDEDQFRSALKELGFEIVEQEGDGNCLFRAIGLQVYGDASMHMEVREKVVCYMQQNEEHFGEFVVDEEFEDYIERKRRFGVHGNNPEIQAVSELFNRPIEVYSPRSGAKPLNIFHKEYNTKDAPIRLSYHDNNHYNAVVDPLNPTAGVGLGLPGLRPGLADKLQVAAATTESDVQSDLNDALAISHQEHTMQQDYLLEKALKESSGYIESENEHTAFTLSDIEATNFDLVQKALQRSLQTFQSDDEQKPKALLKDGNVGVADSNVLDPSAPTNDQYEYPPVVEELVMNGFELDQVLKAYEFIGPSFDQILAFLMSNNNS